jgi:hypothetical protein
MVLYQLAITGQGFKHLEYDVFACRIAHTHNLGYLLIIHGFERMFTVNAEYGVDKSAEAVA